MALGRLSVVLDANIAKFESDLGRASRVAQAQSRQMQQSFERAGKAMGLALAAGVATLGVSIKKSIDDMLQLNALSKQVGMPVEQFTALSAVAKRADLDVQSFAAAMTKADKALTEAQSGKGAAASAFKALGIDPKQVKDNNDLILKAADSLSKYKDGIGKTAVEMTIFSKSGAQLNAFLDQGSESIKTQAAHMMELGVAFGPEAQAQLAAYDNAQKEFADTIAGLRNKLAIALLPSLQSAAEFLANFTKSMDKDAVSEFTTVINMLSRAAIIVGGAFVTAGRAIGATVAFAASSAKTLSIIGNPVALSSALALDPKGTLRGFQNTIAAARNIGGDFVADTKKLWSSLLDQVTEFGTKAKDAVTKATGTDAARKTLAFDPNAGTGKSKAVKAAEDYTKALRDQVLQLQMASKEFELYQLAARGASDADLAAASSLIDVRDALKKQADAQKELTDFVAQHQAAILGVTDAELQFRDTMDTATKALNAHLVSWEQFSRIAAKAVEDMNGKAKDSFDQMSEFAKQAARNMQDAFADFLFDPFKGGIKGMLGDFADMLRKMAAQALAARVFDSIGAWGKQNQGDSGWTGLLAGFAKSFGGGRAAGGPVSAGGMYQVNEHGPELLSVGGRDFLMMGNEGGTVTPRGKFGAGVQIINHVNVQPTSSRRTASQVAEAVARKQQLALARA